MMTERIFKSMMNRLPAGEYDANYTMYFTLFVKTKLQKRNCNCIFYDFFILPILP